MDEWVLQCGAVVSRELQTRGWTLTVSPDAFLSKVIAELQARCNAPGDLTPAAIQRATVRCYARVMFDASGWDGTPQQQHAFLELWEYLYPRALYRLHDSSAAQDATQQALVKIFQKRITCRDPGSFLRWGEQILFHEISERFRSLYQRRLTERGYEYVAREIGIDDLGAGVNDESKESDPVLADPEQNTPEAAFTEPMHNALLAAVRACLENERQVQVLVELFMSDKTFLEVAEQLQTTPLNVQVMRSRALKKLRDCAEMQRLVEDWDL